uniref:HAT C-terminal dimerisation domain-containing protein n=1 Tax=Latimeria chalumnae TaxID=7897 RepID=H3ACG0_LATCH
WVTYCMTKGTIACFFCKQTFSHCAELAFCSGNFSNWKNCYEKLEKHAKCHREAVEKGMYFNNAGLNTGAKLEKAQELHRQMFLKQLSSLKYLVHQGLSVRGNTDMESNLLQMLKTRAEDVPELMQWIEQGQYLSADVINELIETMGNTVLQSIPKDLRNSSILYGIIVDESKDISNKEQMTCILRWVSTDFIGMYQLEKMDAATITRSLKDILVCCNLKVKDCRWQSYDGAANMSGPLSGVATQIKAENLAALNLHCSNHSLDLALQRCAKISQSLRNALDFAHDLAVFIHASPKRMSQYQWIASEYDQGHIENLHLLCPTRWTVRTKSISAVLYNYEALHATLSSISKEDSTHDIRDNDSGLARKLQHLLAYILPRIFSASVNSLSITAQITLMGVNALKDILQRQRDGFHLFYEQTTTRAASIAFIEDPTLPKQRKVPRRFHHGDAAQHNFPSAEDFYRAHYFEANDACICELSRHFDQESYKILISIEDVLINAANGKEFAFSDKQLEAELEFLTGIKQQLPEVKEVTLIDTIVSLLSDWPDTKLLLSNIFHLLQIYLLAPMCIASDERSFSAQRRMKTYLRSNMSEKRYNNLLMLHVHKDRTDETDLKCIARVF